MTNETLQPNDIISSFWVNIKSNRSLLRQRNKKDFLGQYTYDIRNAFCDYIEDLRSKKIITDELANIISL